MSQGTLRSPIEAWNYGGLRLIVPQAIVHCADTGTRLVDLRQEKTGGQVQVAAVVRTPTAE